MGNWAETAGFDVILKFFGMELTTEGYMLYSVRKVGREEVKMQQEKLTERVQVGFSAGQFKVVREEAQTLGMTVSSYIRMVVMSALAQRHEEEKSRKVKVYG